MSIAAPFSFSNQLQHFTEQDEHDRQARMDGAWAYYYGHAADQLETKPGQQNDNVKPNKAKVIVDKGVSFLFGEDIAFKLADEDQARGEDPDRVNPAQVWLDACWAANRKMTLLHKLAMNGGVCGQVFLKIVPNAAGVNKQFPRLINLDPATVSVAWEPDDIEQVASYSVQYSATNPLTKKPVNYRQRVIQEGDGWTSIDEQSDPDSSVWTVTRTTPWPHPYPPIIDAQNLPAPNEYWGLSDIGADVLALNDALSFARSNAQRIIRYHAHPKTVAKGVAGSVLNTDVDGVILLPNPDASLENLEMQSDLTATEQHIDGMEQDIHEVSRIPSISTGTLDSIGPLSGVALSILYQPLLEKTKTKRLLYGDLLVELCRRLLDLANYGNANVVSITWPELLPGDPLQERQAYLLEDQMGVVSKQTIAERLDLDWEKECQRMEEERTTALQHAQQAMGTAPGSQDAPATNPSETLPPDPILNSRGVVGMKTQA